MMFDTTTALRHIAALAFPRRTGSPGEGQAITYIMMAFHEMGLTPEVETFQFGPRLFSIGWRGLPLLLSLFVSVAIFLLPVSRWVSGILCCVALWGIVMSGRWQGWVERLHDRGPMQEAANIIARLNVEGADRDILVIAHYDAKSHTIPLGPKIALFLLNGLLVIILSMLIIWTVVRGVPILPVRALQGLGIVACFIGSLLAYGRSGNRSPGALDNAAGVGVLLTLATHFVAHPPRRTRLTFLATGAEEEGLVGATRYIQRYQSEYDRRQTSVVNYDMPGTGKRVVIVASHGIPPIKTGRRLQGIIDQAARKANVPVVTSSPLLGAGMDHIPIAYRGFESVGIMGEKFHRAVMRAHSPRDTVEGIDTHALGMAGSLGVAIVEEIDTTLK
ncbi:MAG: M28 family peptidase [Candidatus Latescibacteria bacterium]|nr:M28 family peptidase [Candidatus Latescibacterota bacterium]